MQVEAAKFRGVEDWSGKDHPVGDNHGHVRRMRPKRLRRPGIAQGLRGEDGQAETLGHPMDGRGLEFHAAPGGRRRTRVDCRHVVALAEDFGKGGHGKIRRAHKDDAEGHPPAASRLAAFLNLATTRSRLSFER
jgi:hypothetical protein